VSAPPVIVRHLGLREYIPTWRAMRDFTDRRKPGSPSELWLLEHPPVYTQGQAGRAEHLLNPGEIPVVHTDRGGQVTYHGPGQLVVYALLDLKQAGMGIRGLVSLLEGSVIDLLAAFGVEAAARPDAPGVYVDGQKIASLGLRVRRGFTFHGLALNVDMDLEPFGRIDPCGFPGLGVTRLRDLGIDLSVADAGVALLPHLCHGLGMRCQPGEPTRPRDVEG
jgi:lipoyl(octanoyl) transferase